MAKYKVIGPFVTHGAAPGETFEADLSEGEEAYLLEQGAVEKVGAKASDKSKDGGGES